MMSSTQISLEGDEGVNLHCEENKINLLVRGMVIMHCLKILLHVSEDKDQLTITNLSKLGHLPKSFYLPKAGPYRLCTSIPEKCLGCLELLSLVGGRVPVCYTSAKASFLQSCCSHL
jgi:hypothetical protein